MTCILYNPSDKTFGCDSLSTWGNERCPLDVEDKIHRMRHEDREFLVGLSGVPIERKKLFDAFINGTQVTSESDLIVVELCPGGHKAAYLVGGTGGVTEITGHIVATGCGGDLALGAALAGANTRHAIKLAIERNVKCGGKIRLYNIGNVDRKRRSS